MTGLVERAGSKTYALRKLGAKRKPQGATELSEQGRRFQQSRPALSPLPAELLSVLPHNRRGWFEPDADTATLVDIGALSDDAVDDILGVKIAVIGRHLDTQLRNPCNYGC